jgi:hypothetical protein
MRPVLDADHSPYLVSWITSHINSWCAPERLQFIADRLRTRLLGKIVRIPVGSGEFSLPNIQSGSGAHPASRLEDTASSSDGGVKLQTHHLREEWVELYLHPPSYALMAWCLIKAWEQPYVSHLLAYILGTCWYCQRSGSWLSHLTSLCHVTLIHIHKAP